MMSAKLLNFVRSFSSDFAEVRGGQQLRSGGRAAEGPNLALGNKFAALRD